MCVCVCVCVYKTVVGGGGGGVSKALPIQKNRSRNSFGHEERGMGTRKHVLRKVLM